MSEVARETVPCDLCGSAETVVLWSAKDRMTNTGECFTLVRCAVCGLVYVNPRPRESEMGVFYTLEYPSFTPSSGLRRLLKKILLKREVRMLKNMLQAQASILEVGTGVAEDLAYLKESLSAAVQGVDTSIHAVEQSKSVFGVPVFHGGLYDARFPAQEFAYVRMKYVVSHVHSPQRIFAEVSRILRPGGVTMIWAPNFDSWGRRLFRMFWEGGEMPRHLFDVTPRSLSAYCKKNGLEVVKIVHSVVPNTHIHSFRNVLQDRGWTTVSRFFTINPATLMLFLPLSILAALFKQSDRIILIAKKCPTGAR